MNNIKIKIYERILKEVVEKYNGDKKNNKKKLMKFALKKSFLLRR